MSSSVTAAPPPPGAPRRSTGRPWRAYGIAAAFLLPAAVFLGIWVVYPTISTIRRSFFDRAGDSFIGFDNYVTLFTEDTLLTAIKNNVIWVAVVPALVTALGLIFAVLTERVSWSVAFKTAVFMPLAISFFAAGIIWRVMLELDPNRGAVNAGIAVVYDEVRPPGVLSSAQPSGPGLTGTPQAGIRVRMPVEAGGTALLGLTGIRAAEVPEDAAQAVRPTAAPGEVVGTVWRDFRPGGGVPGRVERGELGIPGVTVSLSAGGQTREVTTGPDGVFRFSDLPGPGPYGVGLASSTFREGFDGISWLGESLVTISAIIAYIWIWAGFAMVVIAAGLSALPRDLLEAARTDGASEWQVFRRITVPLLAPVLTVVFITMVINVLKVFDIILSVAPESVQDDANVIALAQWRTSFGGVNDFGLGSAIATFLFVLVVPVLLLNIRRFRREQA